MPPGGHRESPGPPLPSRRRTPSLPHEPQVLPREPPRHPPKELRLLLLKPALPRPTDWAEQAERALKPLRARQGERDMAVTEGLRAAKDRQEQVPALRPGTRLLSPGPWRARCSWPDCVCHWLQLTSSDTPGNRCPVRAEPKEETQSLPSELPGYRKCGHILKTRKQPETGTSVLGNGERRP